MIPPGSVRGLRLKQTPPYNSGHSRHTARCTQPGTRTHLGTETHTRSLTPETGTQRRETTEIWDAEDTSRHTCVGLTQARGLTHTHAYTRSHTRTRTHTPAQLWELVFHTHGPVQPRQLSRWLPGWPWGSLPSPGSPTQLHWVSLGCEGLGSFWVPWATP